MTKTTPSGRDVVADKLGVEILHQIEGLGLIVLTSSQYRNIIRELGIHEDYMNIIRSLQDGHAAIAQRDQARLQSGILYPTPPRRSHVSPGDQPTPPPNNTGDQPSPLQS